MASRKIRGITIEFGADTSKLEQSFSRVKNETKSISKQLGDVNKLLRFNPKNVELMAQKQAKLKDAIQSTTDKLKTMNEMQKNMKAQGVDEASDEYQALRREIIDTEKALETYKRKLTEVDKALYLQNSKLKQLGDNFQKQGDKLKKIGGGMMDIGQKMTMGITLPLAGIGVKAFDMAADLEDAFGATEQIFKGSSNEMKSWANNLESYYGIAEGEALQYANTMGAMLQNIGGLSEKEAAKQSQILTELAGDLSAMFGGTTESAIQALTGALKGNNAMLDNYGMGVNDATIKQKAFDMGLYKGKGTMSLATKQAATLALIMEQTADAQGQAAREADGASGSWKAFKTEIQGLVTEIGEQLLPIITPMIQQFKDWIAKFKELSPEVKETIVKVGLLAGAIGPLITVFGGATKGIGFLIGGLGSLMSWSAKTGAAISAAGGLGPAIGGLATKIGGMMATGGPVLLAIGGIAALGYGAVKLGKHLMSDAIPKVDLFGEGVSEATKKAVGGFLELNEKATNELNSMMFNGDKVTKENSGKIISNFASMREQIVTELETQKDEAKGVLDEMFENSLQFNISEREEMMKTVTEGYDNKIKTTEENEKRIQEILNTAKEEKRALTEEEKKQINGIQMDMRDDGIKILSESEEEQKVIMQRLADNQGVISARGAAEVVRQSAKQRDETIKQAEDEYGERIKLAEQIRAEGGTEAEETANKIIEEAKRQRDEAVGQAKDMHGEVVGEAKKQAGEHVKEVDWETGEVKTKWQVLKEDIGKKAQGIARDVGKWWGETKEKTSKFWEKIKTTASNNINDAKTNISGTAGNIKKSVSEWWSKTKNDTSTKWGNIKSAMSEKFTNAKTSVTELAGNIWTAITDKWDSLKRNTSRKWEQIKEAIMSPIKSAKKWLDEKIKAIKNAFNFEWKLPKFKLPKVSIGMAKSKRFGIPYPKFNVDWNRDGGIFRKPTVIPTMAGLQGFAEPSTGGEAILPLNKLPEMMAEAMEKTSKGNRTTVINYIMLDGKTIATEVTDQVDNNLERKSRRLQNTGGLL